VPRVFSKTKILKKKEEKKRNLKQISKKEMGLFDFTSKGKIDQELDTLFQVRDFFFFFFFFFLNLIIYNFYFIISIYFKTRKKKKNKKKNKKKVNKKYKNKNKKRQISNSYHPR
jgi:hypothetical protein